MQCPKYRSDNPETQRFCAECGTKLITAKDISISATKTLKTPQASKGKTIAEKYEILKIPRSTIKNQQETYALSRAGYYLL